MGFPEFTKAEGIIILHIFGLAAYGYYSLIFWLLSFVKISIGIN